MSETPPNALLIFTRNPEPGKCKTRLAAKIGDRAALGIYSFLLGHTAALCCELEGVDKLVYFSDRLGDGSIWDPGVFRYRLQSGEDLGERMASAFRETLEAGYSRVIIIGSDLYDLSAADLRHAFELLEEKDAVLGPARDGGYYLLGLKRLVPPLFQHKAWGSETVLEESLRDLEGMQVGLLPERNDIDRYEDIAGHTLFEFLINKYSDDQETT
ncbi:TIGR04282 family arsenosugar biosynthesis glycosyltransferase [Robiginitalea marina]|uniref:TIGR04282 family arsenosugar biosynthesis glycosyltransferase n=1 Tax=Robiginitalea marina TaxID=2954105 RepID=A0ABT1AYG4_9FLAO|nr:TIGR04282 family arsenosugar biosynthesis glycosyltransferase [Robiginitalea marina]MCO5724640.1 TIGR04282 family arsenosugar biosynthesis glycosyltransferase [Robiginitalea marina]